MATASKFLFDTSFDEQRPSQPRSKAAERAAAELERAKIEAHAAGVAAGRAEARQEIEAQIGTTLAQIEKHIRALLSDASRQHESQCREAVATVAEMARKLLPGLAKRDTLAEVESLISDCLGRLHDEPRIVVRMADEMLDPLRQRLDSLTAGAGFAGRVILLADSALKATDARVEWADGGIDRDVEAVWREIEDAIQRFVQDGARPSRK